MLMRNFPPKPHSRKSSRPPLPKNMHLPASTKVIKPQVAEIEGKSKDYHHKPKIARELSARSLKSINTSRPNSAVSIKERASSRESSRSHASSLFEDPVLKNELKLSSVNWGLFEIKSGKFIGGARTMKRRQFASLTKIMNFVTILNIVSQFELNPSQIKVIVTEAASKMIGTTAQIKQGYLMTLQDLFYGMMLPSGNDAAYQVAQIGGAAIKLFREEKRKKQLLYSQQFLKQELIAHSRSNVIRFLGEMNRYSKQIGLNRSKWSNPHGLSNRQNVSTVKDLAKLCTYAMQKEQFRKVVNTREYCCLIQMTEPISEDKQNKEGNNIQETIKTLRWTNTNKMLEKGWNGVKTGITPNAGPCLAASVNKRLGSRECEFLVILGTCQSMEKRWEEAEQLVDWAVSNEHLWNMIN